MIVHPSLAFAQEVVERIKTITDEYELAEADLLVEAFRHGQVSGLTISHAISSNRVNVFLEINDRIPRVVYGSLYDFDSNTGWPKVTAHCVDYRYGKPDSIAHLCVGWLIHDQPVWLTGKDEEESE